MIHAKKKNIIAAIRSGYTVPGKYPGAREFFPKK
jgi:hypothetical protein